MRTHEGIGEGNNKGPRGQPDQVQVRAVEGEQVTVFELRVHPSDVGKVRRVYWTSP